MGIGESRETLSEIGHGFQADSAILRGVIDRIEERKGQMNSILGENEGTKVVSSLLHLLEQSEGVGQTLISQAQYMTHLSECIERTIEQL